MDATLLNHLWQSTLFTTAAWAFTRVLRHCPARTRYWIWFAASVKFLLPFSALVALGLRLRPSSPVGMVFLPQPLLSATLSVAEPLSTTRSADTFFGSDFAVLVSMIWAFGLAIVLARWCASWLRARSLVRTATPHPMDLDIEVRVSAEFSQPGVFGIRRPVLLLPSAVVSRLRPAELDAVIAHERCHVRNRDNRTAAVRILGRMRNLKHRKPRCASASSVHGLRY